MWFLSVRYVWLKLIKVTGNGNLIILDVYVPVNRNEFDSCVEINLQVLIRSFKTSKFRGHVLKCEKQELHYLKHSYSPMSPTLPINRSTLKPITTPPPHSTPLTHLIKPLCTPSHTLTLPQLTI